jgi:hypothetical protein
VCESGGIEKSEAKATGTGVSPGEVGSKDAGSVENRALHIRKAMLGERSHGQAEQFPGPARDWDRFQVTLNPKSLTVSLFQVSSDNSSVTDFQILPSVNTHSRTSLGHRFWLGRGRATLRRLSG